ncbi:DUF4386 domain-containing protein [Mucilaginibacter sp.]|uniref:DUF4386 domain-containing protein n=1 Tax=Mucilaginibacter sp. TaxID=1882438 RepID=UPI0026250AF5|nr:DUF4386 domain-containing protein [Mucilaginibacter sp.]MDB4921821.1 hypothetical protein [Mucilaginibacter sp.]
MEKPTTETSRQFYAKVAGFTILFYIAVGLTSVTLYSRATGAEGTNAILADIASHATAVGMTVILELLECFSALVLAVTLYRLTRDESQELAMLGMVCRVCESVLAAIGIRTTLGLLWLAAGGHAPANGALGTFLLMPIPAAMVGSPFFALGSMIFSYLMLRSRIVPVPLAGFGVVASALLVVCVPLQLAGFLKGPVTTWIWIPMFAFQFLLGLWLLIKGVATPASRQPA